VYSFEQKLVTAGSFDELGSYNQMRENGNYNISQQERKANIVYEMKISDFSKLPISLQFF
jgi:hypothetical protein